MLKIHQPLDIEYNRGENLNEPRRSTRISEMLERAMRGAPLDVNLYENEELESDTPEELDEWQTHPMYEVDYNDGFEASERLRASIIALDVVGAQQVASDNSAKQPSSASDIGSDALKSEQPAEL